MLNYNVNNENRHVTIWKNKTRKYTQTNYAGGWYILASMGLLVIITTALLSIRYPSVHNMVERKLI